VNGQQCRVMEVLQISFDWHYTHNLDEEKDRSAYQRQADQSQQSQSFVYMQGRV